jgi:drug/metabolite transporter (DMT)-like permease
MRWKSDGILLFAAFVWGSGFVAQRIAATTQLSTFTFNGWRFLIAALVIYIAARIFRKKSGSPAQPLTVNETLWMALTGVLLFAASALQQAGLAYTTIGNASFITGLYVVLIPLFMYLIWRERLSWMLLGAVILAVFGIMLLSLQGELRLSLGDILEMGGAIMWALQIILVGRLSSRGVDVLRFSVTQFATCGVLNLILAFILEAGVVQAGLDGWPVVLYSALFPIAMGFSLQIIGQRHAPPADAAIIMNMEAVFGTLFGYLFLGETMNIRQVLGCLLIFAAILLAQVKTSGAKAPELDAV